MNVQRDAKPMDLGARTKEFALRVIRVYTALERSDVGQVIGKQMLRSGTSVGAHYREATRSRSNAEFVSKVEGALQELDETAYWFELLAESGTMTPRRLCKIQEEADELTAILVTCAKNTKAKKRR